MLFVSKATESTSFDGALVLWVVGGPFIVGVILQQSHIRHSVLTETSVVKFETDTEVIDHLMVLLQLIASRSNSLHCSYVKLPKR